MASKRLQGLFAEAAEIAATVPEDLRPAAFNRALDLLLARASGGAGAAEADAILRGSAKDRRILGIYGTELILEKSVDVLNFATSRLGLEELSAEQIAALVNERFGLPATGTVVSLALSGAGELVRGIQRGGETLYRIVAPTSPGSDKKPKSRSKRGAKTRKAQEPVTPGQVVRDLVALGFFQTAHTAADLALHLEKKGIDFTVRQVVPVLTTLMDAGLLVKKTDASGKATYRSR